MPFQSKSQMRYLFAKHPKMAKEFAHATSDMGSLPEHVSNQKKRRPAIPDTRKIKSKK